MDIKKISIVTGIVIVLGVGVWWFSKDFEETSIYASTLTGIHYAGEETHVIEGSITLPNPCYKLESNIEVQDNQAHLRFASRKTAEVCAQVLYDAPFRATFTAPSSVEISAGLDGNPIELNLERRALVEVVLGGEFNLATGEEKWVEDLRITFTGVENDNRCPSDAECIIAGWVTLRFVVGEEEVALRLPGDQEVSNAQVVGSYIITLIDVQPVPVVEAPLEKGAYRATLRVETHELKG